MTVISLKNIVEEYGSTSISTNLPLEIRQPEDVLLVSKDNEKIEINEKEDGEFRLRYAFNRQTIELRFKAGVIERVEKV